jgi:hypothetical protein
MRSRTAEQRDTRAAGDSNPTSYTPDDGPLGRNTLCYIMRRDEDFEV